MRVWSVAPRYLDRQGLTACWREGLLAQAVLAGRTRGYRAHPQLVRFRRQPDPLASIGAYLAVVADAATERGYRFDRARIDRPAGIAGAGSMIAGGAGSASSTEGVPRIPVTDGQVALEWAHLRRKLAERSPAHLASVTDVAVPDVHPLFVVVPGPVEDWERAGDAPTSPTAARRPS